MGPAHRERRRAWTPTLSAGHRVAARSRSPRALERMVRASPGLLQGSLLPVPDRAALSTVRGCDAAPGDLADGTTRRVGEPPIADRHATGGPGGWVVGGDPLRPLRTRHSLRRRHAARSVDRARVAPRHLPADRAQVDALAPESGLARAGGGSRGAP